MTASHSTPQVPPADNHEPANNGRDSRGRFVAGNLGGPGNPFARQVAQLRSALVNAVTEEDMRQIANELIGRAKSGNLAAIKLLFQYVLGKPAEAVNPDTLDIEEWRQCRAPLGGMMEEMQGAMHSLPAPVACDMVAIAHLAHQTRMAETVGQSLERADQKASKTPKEHTNANATQQSAATGKTAKKDEGGIKPPSRNGLNGARRSVRAAAAPSTNGHHGEPLGHWPPLG